METDCKMQAFELDYPRLTMFEMVNRMAEAHPQAPAYEFFGKKTTFRGFVDRIEQAARAFTAAGLGKDDVITICMPNTPQGLVCFYAVNRIGAVANMVHPLSAEEEITFYLNISESRYLLTMDMFYGKAAAARERADHPVTILTARMQEELPVHMGLAYTLKAGRKYLRFPDGKGESRTGAGEDTGLRDMTWKAFLRKGAAPVTLPAPCYEDGRTAVILYSGGTSGTPKGICLTDLNINACAMQARDAIGVELGCGQTMLSCMPMFHGFGLGINLHTILIHGACCILMPTFTSKTYASMMKKKRPNFIAGVPTIFEALLHLPQLDGVDLSFLKGMYSGGDTLPVELKKRIDAFLKDHGADIQVREGYGLTECVTASCLTPLHEYREGSIGIPFKDTFYAIVRPGTEELLPPGTEGEIILRGPTVMTGYLKNEEETAQTLRRLPDGHVWLYTGDLGRMDEDGFVYFIQRAKRMIITNGYNVYPGQIENAIDSIPEVVESCVIGVPDPRRMQRVQAYVVLKKGVEPSEERKAQILAYLEKKVARYALPREIVFKDALPRTLVGKTDYRKLLQEAENRAA